MACFAEAFWLQSQAGKQSNGAHHKDLLATFENLR